MKTMKILKIILIQLFFCGILMAQGTSFDPIGKTEEEITTQWGPPTSRMDLGSESELDYSKGKVSFEDGKATKFNPLSKAEVKAQTESLAPSADLTQERMKADIQSRDDQSLFIKRLEEELEDKRKEIREKEDSRDRKEILTRFDEAKSRAWNANYYSYSNYQVQLKNLEKQRDDDLEQVDRRLGIKQLKEDVQRLEGELADKRKQLYQ